MPRSPKALLLQQKTGPGLSASNQKEDVAMPVQTKQSAKKTGLAARRSTVIRQAIELSEGTWERIREKAYELWAMRGYREGNALQDWLDAEEIVMESIHEARE